MFRNTLTIVLALVIAVAATGQMPEKTGKKIDNPAYTMWAGYAPGTWVTMKSTSDFGGQKTETETTTTLKSVSKEKVVVTMKSTMLVAGQKIEQPASDQAFEAKIDEYKMPEVEDAGEKPKIETSKDTVTIGKKQLACTKTKSTMTIQGSETVTTSWTCDEVPGQMVKAVTKMTAGSTTMEVTGFEVKK